jgi:hypothetical protein
VSDFCVEDRVVLLKHVQKFVGEEASDLCLVNIGDVGHELEVVHNVLILLCGILFERSQLYKENTPMGSKFGFVLVRLTLDFVLELSKGVSLLEFIQSELSTVLCGHEIHDLGVFASNLNPALGARGLRSLRWGFGKSGVLFWH